MKILFVYDNSIGIGYLRDALSTSVIPVKLSDYPAINQDEYDGLIYNTFPDETHRHKFRKDLIEKTDEKFMSFRGPKILADSHDDGHKDGYSRFNDSTIPRIKTTPGYEMLNRLNIVMSMPFAVNIGFCKGYTEKSIPLLYCARTDGYPTDIRVKVNEILKPFDPFTKRLPFPEYIQTLRQAGISVVAPGWGDACVAHFEALATGALLIAHESVTDVKLLPYAALYHDQDYVIFNLDNLKQKVEDLLSDHSRARSIAASGREKFFAGYDPNRTKADLLQFFCKKSAQDVTSLDVIIPKPEKEAAEPILASRKKLKKFKKHQGGSNESSK